MKETACVYSIFNAAVQRQETLAGQREVDHQHGAGLAAGGVRGIALDLLDPGIRQQRNIEVRGLLGFADKPQAGRNLGHREKLRVVSG
jgi:hypothetical protein